MNIYGEPLQPGNQVEKELLQGKEGACETVSIRAVMQRLKMPPAAWTFTMLSRRLQVADLRYLCAHAGRKLSTNRITKGVLVDIVLAARDGGSFATLVQAMEEDASDGGSSDGGAWRTVDPRRNTAIRMSTVVNEMLKVCVAYDRPLLRTSEARGPVPHLFFSCPCDVEERLRGEFGLHSRTALFPNPKLGITFRKLDTTTAVVMAVAVQPRIGSSITIGDVLTKVGSQSVDTMTFDAQVDLIKMSRRPIVLSFQRGLDRLR